MDTLREIGVEQILDEFARELFVPRQSIVDLGQKSAVNVMLEKLALLCVGVATAGGQSFGRTHLPETVVLQTPKWHGYSG